MINKSLTITIATLVICALSLPLSSSALAQGDDFDELVEGPEKDVPKAAAAERGEEQSTTGEKTVLFEFEPRGPDAVPEEPPLPKEEIPEGFPGPYNRNRAMALSFGWMLAPMVAGGTVAIVGIPIDNIPMMVAGSIVAGLGLTWGPSAGYFYVGRFGHAVG